MSEVAADAGAAAAAPPAGPTYDGLRPRVQALLEPVSAAAPTGVNARTDARFDAINVEVTKQDSLEPKPVAWPTVVDKGSKFLQTVSKDLLVGSYVALGLVHTERHAGLTKGFTLLAEMLDKYPDNVFPERPKGRANALLYALDRLTTREGTGILQRDAWKNVTAADRVTLEELALATAQLETVARAQLGPNTPGFASVFEEIGKMQAAIPAPVEAAPAPAAAAPAANGAGAPVAVTAAAPSFAPSISVAVPESSGDLAAFLPQLGAAMVDAAHAGRRADPKDPAAYRALRVGLYLHVAAAPPAGPGGRTALPGLMESRREQIEKMRTHGRFLDIIDESESALNQARFVLDLHRYTADALAGLGPDFARARAALVVETGTLLRRFPELLGYQTGAGEPLADAATRQWIESEVVPAASAKSADAGGGDTTALDEARKLASSGKIEEALELLMPRAVGGASARERFVARLLVAQILAGASQHTVARAHLEALDKELLARGLEEWDPALARACLEAHLQCLRTLARADRATVVPGSMAVIYDRLSKLDPVAALRAGS